MSFRGWRFLTPFLRRFQIMAFEAGVPEGGTLFDIEVVLSDSKQMIELKKEHFNIDKDTDVIAFPVDNPMLPPGCFLPWLENCFWGFLKSREMQWMQGGLFQRNSFLFLPTDSSISVDGTMIPIRIGK